MTPLFRQKAPKIMRDLMRDFPIFLDDAAAIVGNAGHESAGFTQLQELNPTVKGSRGGLGYFQWTGPRRRSFETWCNNTGLQPSSDAANYGFLCVELRGSEKAAIPALKKAVGLEAKVKAFEMAFERAGAKHYPSRIAYARDALTAFGKAASTPAPAPPAEPPPVAPATPTTQPRPSPPPATPAGGKVAAGAGLIALAAAALAGFWDKISNFFAALFGG